MMDNEPKEFSKSELNSIVRDIVNSSIQHYQEEIRIKDLQIRMLEKSLEDANRPIKRGRPKNSLSFSKTLLSALNLNERVRGRPKKHMNAKEDVLLWDNFRKNKSQALNKDYITDKETAEMIIKEAFPDISEWKKRQKTAELKSHIKSLRDITNIRSRTRKKTS